MARYEHLPIYKAALDAAVHFERVVAGFSRYHKYSLGTELRHASRAVIGQVIRANAGRFRKGDQGRCQITRHSVVSTPHPPTCRAFDYCQKARYCGKTRRTLYCVMDSRSRSHSAPSTARLIAILSLGLLLRAART